MDTALNLREVEKITVKELASYQFESNEIYTRDEDKRVRIVSLDKSMIMARNPSVKTLLVLNTTKGFRSIQTPVLSMNLSGITIEGNVFIPMHAIYSAIIE